jgi:8-oxo-dGTP diphosphatase
MNNKSLTIGTVCFLIDEKTGKILLLERSRSPMKNKVTGVGGKTNFEEDILSSCIREIKEETGFEAKNLRLNGIIKTIEESLDSSWILFIYTCCEFYGQQSECPEGKLFWIDRNDVQNQNLIGFIKELIPHILNGDSFEGTIIHDMEGNVISKQLRVASTSNILKNHKY